VMPSWEEEKRREKKANLYTFVMLIIRLIIINSIPYNHKKIANPKSKLPL